MNLITGYDSSINLRIETRDGNSTMIERHSRYHLYKIAFGATVFHSSVYIEAYYERMLDKYEEFQLSFSFQKGDAPKRGDDEMFDCSGPKIENFQQLRCNLYTECEGGEDEQECEHTTGLKICKPGFYRVGQK